jgi:uncharacterized protein (DUF433 family)
MDYCDGEMVTDPSGPDGALVFKGTDVPFHALFDYLAAERILDEFLNDFPTVARDDALDALRRARALLVGHSI